MDLALSVTDFVRPLEPTGSLDASMSFRMDEDAMALGARLHARVQKRMMAGDPTIACEVSLQQRFEYQDFSVLVRGRIDLLLPEAVEEIKTTFQPAALLRALAEQPFHPYAMQARMYAWMQAMQTGRPCTCRLRVISLLDETETLMPVALDPDTFGAWVAQQVEGLHRAYLVAQARAVERGELGGRLAFPFAELRPGQTCLMDRVGESLTHRTPLMLQAPTGLGKTAAILFPALKCALEGNLRVFYATPRNSQHAAAEALVRRLVDRGFPVRSVTLRAKERMCPQDEVHCTPEACPRARDYYDRLKASGVLDLLASEGCVGPARVTELADLWTLCPFELSLDAAQRADVVIGDYNYALSPQASVHRFFGTPEERARTLLLLDEAHNLPARAADWFSPMLDGAQMEALKKTWKGPRAHPLRGKFLKQMGRCLKLLQSLEGDHRPLQVDPALFQAEDLRLRRLVAKAAGDGAALSPGHPLVQLQRLWSEFCAQLPEAEIVTWIPPGRLQITCPEASSYLSERMKSLAQVVLFSGTLKPFAFYERLSGLEASLQEEVPSPFPVAHRKVLVVPQISTLLRRRPVEIPRIAEFISRVLPLRIGNYLVFFPSFDFLEKTRPLLHLPGFDVRAQPRQATPADVEGLLEDLRTQRNRVVLAVQGGSLSEGIDLPGEALVGCIVVGPPLPPFDLERQLVRNHFETRDGQGERYTYIYPAMAKAVQAAGRVIRTPEDRGLIIFLDGRFLQEDYAACFPAEWFQGAPQNHVSAAILADVSAFWSRQGNDV